MQCVTIKSIHRIGISDKIPATISNKAQARSDLLP